MPRRLDSAPTGLCTAKLDCPNAATKWVGKITTLRTGATFRQGAAVCDDCYSEITSEQHRRVGVR